MGPGTSSTLSFSSIIRVCTKLEVGEGNGLLQVDVYPSDGDVTAGDVVVATAGPNAVEINTLYNLTWNSGSCTSQFLHVFGTSIVSLCASLASSSLRISHSSAGPVASECNSFPATTGISIHCVCSLLRRQPVTVAGRVVCVHRGQYNSVRALLFSGQKLARET